MKPMNITKLKNIYIVPRSESFLFPSRLPSALVAWEHSPCSVPCGFAARKVAALESHAADLSTFYRFVRLAFTLLLAPLLSSELMPCALTPAYGVTSICRFVQAVTALSIVPTVDRSSPLLSLGLLAVLFGLLSISFCHPSRHLASAFPHVQPSSLFGPSPRVSTAGAYCWQSIVTPRLPWWFSGTHP